MDNTISALDLELLMEKKKINIIDVRDENEFKRGHIKNSINIPLKYIEEKCMDFKEDEIYYIICKSGMRSSRACQFLCNSKNFKAINLNGGIMSWKGELVSD
ncbi:rhodanese-like domain-containing protein [Miniphocaeibacter halophilus]|uniref:Rhodanese-like domain-containing protein n=1 Tax=Miniphocaeibacter halophilus TaxID=2931922 RepID=A0AC61MSK0_9FIRM|nr:rhodanese-like domain-containing protein [Miniphocaeibacter halophilus]QQK08635.1 rhodanese-like domain-containing protein [Miniphocaeibacter halophilus]